MSDRAFNIALCVVAVMAVVGIAAIVLAAANLRQNDLTAANYPYQVEMRSRILYCQNYDVERRVAGNCLLHSGIGDLL